jgi:hypothetical protein
MDVRRYLPSAKLVSIVFSLALSVGLVFAADRLTHRTALPVSLGVDSNSSVNENSDWEAALAAIQAQNASSTFATPDPNFVENLLQAAKSPNVTETVGKTLLINLSNAKSQGLGDDIPTQNQIISAAMAQIKNQQYTPAYTTADLTIVPASNSSLHAYGNGVMKALSAHPEASEQATLLSIDYAVEGGDKTQGAKLASIGAAYKAAATDLLAVPVPQTLAPLHLEIVNNLLRVSATYADMQTITSDPLRGLAALQAYETLMDEGARVFTYVAQTLSKGGILFSKDEPGSAWSIFVSP